ncbi:MAG: S-adenosylmethionine:tRNA ribosyltransferase-isomerase [Bacteroidaceae bacterium]|nr:S-adenosylmethionine:tRNA ribosyltransferase-isomerase [Bacteroidaceae bacterium]
MKGPKDIQIADYAYELPDERIAKYPLAERDASKLLIYEHGNIRHLHFRDLPQLLPTGSLLVMNNTRVIQARLHFRKAGQGALIEVFCLEPAQPHDYVLMFQQTAHCTWHCLVGNSKKWKTGPLTRSITVEGRALTLEVLRGEGDLIHFSWQDETVTWAQVLDACGELPIPPYLNRHTEQSDLTTYQTVYSKVKGSVAAPTAGLHFTPAVLAALDARGIERAELTLHVGAGTFKPVKSERMEGHTMHAEWIYVPRSVIEALLQHGGECTAVGTTSVRTLESLYYIGQKILCNPEATEEELKVGQWEPYEVESLKFKVEGCCQQNNQPISAEQGAAELSTFNYQLSTMAALHAILDWMDRHHTDALHTSTQIIIAPGYQYHIVRRIITNFHQPQSTLLLLVAAFVGTEHWRDIYAYALEHDFRFLSYGDSSLLIP